MTDEHGVLTPSRNDRGANRKPLTQEDYYPQSTLSISLSVSEVETAVFGRTHWCNLTAPNRRWKTAGECRILTERNGLETNTLESGVGKEEDPTQDTRVGTGADVASLHSTTSANGGEPMGSLRASRMEVVRKQGGGES